MNGLIAWSVLSSTLVYFRIPKDDGSGDYDDATTSENLLGELIVAFLLTHGSIGRCHVLLFDYLIKVGII